MQTATPRAAEPAVDRVRVVPHVLRHGAGVCFMLAAAGAVGCGSSSQHYADATTRPAVATDADPKTADPAYWLSQPATASVFGTDLDTLWSAAERVSENYLFPIDRRDRRDGMLTTQPVISAQWFEPWRPELQTADDVAQSSVATVRRSIRWKFTPTDGGYSVTPKVLIERQSLTEERVSGQLSRTYFQRQNDTTFGTHETDRNVILPDNYFYPVGRDVAFEKVLAEKLRTRLNEVAAR
ncbi:MAG: hypothetical protein QM754_14335 [Tepidisphaeraceae bacterium]